MNIQYVKLLKERACSQAHLHTKFDFYCLYEGLY